MNYSKRIVILVILIALVIISTAFILINSAMDFEKSHSSSGAITDAITSTDDIDEWNRIELIIRKLAHVIEYAVLGVCVACLLCYISHFYSLKLYGFGSFFVLLVAVLDEHIQSFSDRVSSTSDIFLDFLGSIIGVILVVGVLFVVRLIINKKRERLAK